MLRLLQGKIRNNPLRFDRACRPLRRTEFEVKAGIGTPGFVVEDKQGILAYRMLDLIDATG